VLAAALFGLMFASTSVSALPRPQGVKWSDSAGHTHNAETLTVATAEGSDTKIDTPQPRRPDRSGIHAVQLTTSTYHYSTNFSENVTFDGVTRVGFGHAGHTAAPQRVRRRRR
jgi:hypothetical protein